ncbi:hypothetical protein J4032_33500 [Streptomyces formicae]|uniref:Ribbon-helix-helix protein CopG domain-containing protein n=1 Tax=Streptomyces formicae TaxID=1616117 RepID=A0ABY3WSV6_9ACTN|nr:hypothetical protein [Streptomyces formicae]UNM15723.1 hypothetical protein J4032_33500 [Streptomyces formicae]
MASTTIQVSREARDHLAVLAAERGLTLGQLVQQLAEREPTKAQIAERLRADRDAARQNMGSDMSDDEFDQAPDVLGNIYKIAAEKVRAARGSAA